MIPGLEDIFNGYTMKVTKGPRITTIIFKCKDRFTEKNNVEQLLIARGVKFESKIVPSITRSLDTIVINSNDL